MIAAAAIKYRNCIVSMPRPARHDTIILAVFNRFSTKSIGPDVTQGFITDRGEFVDRVQGLQEAKNYGQIIHKHGDENKLFSEDMW